MSCTKEEIEQKRLQALKRKQEALLRHAKSSGFNKLKNNTIPTTSYVKSIYSKVPFASPNFNKNRDGSIKTVQHTSPHKFNSDKPGFGKAVTPLKQIPVEKFFGEKKINTATCAMISDERFRVETSLYLAPLIEAFKTIPSRSYDITTKMWNFHIMDYDKLINTISEFKTDVQIVGLPKFVYETFKNDSTEKEIDTPDLSVIDCMLVNSLMPFQRDGICYAISKGGRCMIADDMGLGKTIQALGVAHYFKNSWPLLIVAPSSVRYQWSHAIFEFLPSVPTMHIHQFTNAKDIISDEKIVIVSYDLLARASQAFMKKTFGFVILDECHALKSVKTARYQAVHAVTQKARHVLLLSGTPILSRPIEIYSQIKLMLPHFMGYCDYGKRYCAGKRLPYAWDFSGSSNMQELQLLLKRTCLIRRLKADVLQQLPTKKRELIMLDAELIKAGTQEMKELAKKLEKPVLNALERHNALIQYYNESSFAKQKAICGYVTSLFETRRKCLIYGHHQNVLNAVCKVAEKMKIKYIRIDGRTSSEQRKSLVDQFQNQDYIAAILSITAANAGITLTAAKLVVFAELFWNPGILCQAEDRVHRIGQSEPVLIQYLIAKGTADDFLWPLIKNKISVLNQVGLEQDFTLNDTTVQDHKDKNQTTLNNFVISTPSPKDETSARSDKTESQKDNTEDSSYSAMDEIEELLNLNEEDFADCDWDEIP